MKVVIINKSDSRGGAAVVSYRLMKALRAKGVEASMLVAEKLTDDPDVHRAGTPKELKRTFLRERLRIFLGNGFSRKDLFKADLADTGLPLSEHPMVREADIVLLGWINQGLLSLEEIGRIAAQKPVVWVMHDMWCATGICHHAGVCERFKGECGRCPLLHWRKGAHDLSARTWERKGALYQHSNITFVAVSHWLEERCRASSLMRDAHIKVIGNPFPMPDFKFTARYDAERLELLMVAARIDDPIKGLDTLTRSLQILREKHPAVHRRIHLTLLGTVKDRASLAGLCVPYDAPGAVSVTMIEPFYRQADILVSPSSYETLPGTLVEAQVYGAIPVAFDSGGQRDIVVPGLTGVLAYRHADAEQTAEDFAQAIVDAAGMLDNTSRRDLAGRMYESVATRFGQEQVADAYIREFKQLLT